MLISDANAAMFDAGMDQSPEYDNGALMSIFDVDSLSRPWYEAFSIGMEGAYAYSYADAYYINGVDNDVVRPDSIEASSADAGFFIGYSLRQYNLPFHFDIRYSQSIDAKDRLSVYAYSSAGSADNQSADVNLMTRKLMLDGYWDILHSNDWNLYFGMGLGWGRNSTESQISSANFSYQANEVNNNFIYDAEIGGGVEIFNHVMLDLFTRLTGLGEVTVESGIGDKAAYQWELGAKISYHF